MDGFRRLMTVVLIAGLTAGAVLSAIQFLAIRPMIETAEVYEAQLVASGTLPHEESHEWEPAEGFERVGYTVASTLLLGVGYAALLFGGASLLSLRVGVREGVLLGLAAFASFSLAPAIGLPPKPPGVQGAELNAGQMWWAMTAAATAIGLGLIAFSRGRWVWRIAGLVVLVLPHLIGAPPMGVPLTDELIALSRKFAIVSVATQGVFWLTLGAVGGFWSGRDSKSRSLATLGMTGGARMTNRSG